MVKGGLRKKFVMFNYGSMEGKINVISCLSSASPVILSNPRLTVNSYLELLYKIIRGGFQAKCPEYGCWSEYSVHQ